MQKETEFKAGRCPGSHEEVMLPTVSGMGNFSGARQLVNIFSCAGHMTSAFAPQHPGSPPRHYTKVRVRVCASKTLLLDSHRKCLTVLPRHEMLISLARRPCKSQDHSSPIPALRITYLFIKMIMRGVFCLRKMTKSYDLPAFCLNSEI